MNTIDKIEFKIVHSTHYFERDLFLLEIDDRYTMVYRGSGLNGGKKGRILPFFYLQATPPRFGDARNGIVLGYIHKEFYFNRNVVKHYKEMDYFGKGTELFLERLEKELPAVLVVEQDIANLSKIAKSFNDVVKSYIKVYQTEPVLKTNWFDWGVLNMYLGFTKDEKN